MRSCLNCRSEDHYIAYCPHNCSKCRAPAPDLDENGKRVEMHECEEEHQFEGFQKIFDCQYVRLVDTVGLSDMDGATLLEFTDCRERFVERLGQESTSVLKDSVIVASRDKTRQEDNPLWLPYGVGAYNVTSLVRILDKFHLEKLRRYEAKRFFDPNMIIERHVVFHGYSELIFTFPLPMSNPDFEGLLRELKPKTRFVIKFAASDSKNQIEVIQIRQEINQIVLLTENVSKLIPGSKSQFVTFSFEFGVRDLVTDLDVMEAMRNNSELLCPNWLSTFVHDFHEPFDIEAFDLFGQDVRSFVEEKVPSFGVLWSTLDFTQQDALVNFLSTDSHALIGPPGTGKTFVVALAIVILLLHTDKNILVVASRNRSSDEIINKVSYLMDRYVQVNGESFPVNNAIKRRYPEHRTKIGVNSALALYASSLPASKLKVKPSDELMKTRCVVTTIGHSRHKDFDYFNPDIMFVDESALVPVSEFLGVVGRQFFAYDDPDPFDPTKRLSLSYRHGSRLKQLHLIGDVYQMLPRIGKYPSFTDKADLDAGMTISPLMRFIRNCQASDYTVLDHCRRGPHEIFQLPFDLFYKGRQIYADFMPRVGITIAKDAKSAHFGSIVGSTSPIQSLYVESSGSQVASQSGTSLENSSFRLVALELIKLLLEYGTLHFPDGQKHKVRQDNIYYLSMYKKQGNKMRTLLAQNGIDKVQVMTADQAQGDENFIVVVDTVRTDGKPGFMEGRKESRYGDKHNGRLNVALTRSKCFRTVIGHVQNMPDSDLRTVAYHHKNSTSPHIKCIDLTV